MAYADVAWVDVLPSMRQFAPELDKQLGSIMPGAGRSAGKAFGTGFSSGAVSEVEAASTKMAAALRKVEEAAGKLRIAETNLNDVRSKASSSATQLVTAEEKFATARRNLTSANETLTTTTTNVARAQRDANAQVGEGNRQVGQHVSMLGNLRSSLGMMRDAVITAWGAWQGISMVTKFLGDAAQGAATLEKTVLRTKLVFGSTADEMISWSETADSSMGLSQNAALDAATMFGNLFHTMGMAAPASRDMSQRLVELASDLASFRGADPSDVLAALQKGLLGAAKPMRQYGVDVSAAALKQEALNLGLTDGSGALTLAEKSQAAYSIILRQTGLAQGDFARNQDNLINSQRTASAEWANAKDELGKLIEGPMAAGVRLMRNDFIPAFGAIVGVIGGAVDWFARLPGPIQAGAGALGLWLLLSGPWLGFVQTIMGGVRNLLTGFATSVTEMGVLRGAASGFLGLFGGPWGLAITGATIALGFLVSWLTRSKDAAKDNTQAEQELADALKSSGGAIDENVRKAAAKIAQDKGLYDAAKIAGIGLYDMTSALVGEGDSYAQVMTQLVRYRDAHTYMNGYRDEEAVKVSAAILQLQSLNGTTETSIQKARDLAVGVQGEAVANTDAAAAASQHQQELDAMKQAASDAKSDVDDLKLALDLLTQGHISVAEAEAAFYDATSKAKGAMEGLSGALVQNGGTIDVTNEKGRAAQKVLFDIRSADDQLIASYEAQGMTAAEVEQKDAALRESFIKSAMQMGFSRKAAEDLANQILGIPAERNTRITADTSQANAAAAALQAQIDALHGRTVTITAEVEAGHYGGASNWIMMPRALGGPITGWSPNDHADNVPVAATAGEFMQPVPSVKHYGTGFMEAVRTRRFPRELAMGFAGGGMVPPVSIQAELDDAVYTTKMNALAQQLGQSLEPAMGYVAALNFAKAQVGKPYIWGGVGPYGYDCSGFMSAITNVIRGNYPYQRVGSTANFPWPGFRYGYGSFTIGSTPNAGGGIGHMAGTLLGVNVESTDGSVRIGAAARGADDNLFWNRATLLDRGGMWPPGWGLNLTGDSERVLRPEEDNYFRRFVDQTRHWVEGGGGATIGHLTLVANDRDQGREIVEKLVHRLRVADRGGRYTSAPVATVFGV